MVSYKNQKDKQLHLDIVANLKTIKEGLSLNDNLLVPQVVLANDLSDITTLNTRLLLLSRICQYLSIMQGDALELQKSYKTPELYGLYTKVEQLNKSVKNETDILRTLLSTAREQIKLK